MNSTNPNTTTELSNCRVYRVGGCPYFDFYNADCMEIMKQYPDKYFDLAIVDPPYGLPKTSAMGAGKLKNRIFKDMHRKGWDTAPTPEYFKELFRVSKQQIIWGGNYFDLPPTRGFLIWDKEQPWENFAACEFAWTSFDVSANMFREATTRTGETKIHPTQKSANLYSFCIIKYAQDGFKILDTHLGSASIAIAVHKANVLDKMNLHLTGIEIDADYFRAAMNRIKKHVSQGTLPF